MTTKLGIFVGEDNWMFFNEIFRALASQYQVEVFRRRTLNVPLLQGPLNRWMFRRDVQALLNHNDVCFFEWASELLAVASHMPKRSRIVTRLHRFELYQWANRINWDNVDKIIVVSQAKKKEFQASFPEQASKIVVSSPSISLEKFSYIDKQFSGNIGTLCSLSPRKRVYDLILTFYELSQKRQDLHLHIGGEMEDWNIDYYVSMKKLVSDLNLTERVTFYGRVAETWNWLHQIDIFISNSYSEGLQVAPMEAMATGCYCLSHRWSGAEELVPEENLYYTNPELQSLILQYCELPDQKKKEQRILMRDIAQRKFDIRTTILEIEKTIESSLDRDFENTIARTQSSHQQHI